jgi:cell filamentation protein
MHSFREGNGRAQRAFFSQLAHDAGQHIAWVRMDPNCNMAASAAAHHGDLGPLRAMLDQLTDLPHPSGTPGPAAGPAA